jgi:hypothetical protein
MTANEVGGAPDGALTRAEHLLEVHRPREALRAVAAALTQDPQNVTALCLATRAELDLNEPGRAKELAARAAAAQRPVELAPLEADTHAVLGRVAVEDGNQTAAEEALREALRLNPDHAAARNDLGCLQLLRKDHFGAASQFAHAAASDVRMDVAQHNIDAALTMAVGRVVFWVSISVFVLGRFAVKESDGAVGFGYALLAVLVALAIWQIVVIVPASRGRLGPYLRLLPHRDRMMTATVGLLVLGMIALMVMCVVPPDSRFWPLMVGVPAVLGSRLLLELRARKLVKA